MSYLDSAPNVDLDSGIKLWKEHMYKLNVIAYGIAAGVWLLIVAVLTIAAHPTPSQFVNWAFWFAVAITLVTAMIRNFWIVPVIPEPEMQKFVQHSREMLAMMDASLAQARSNEENAYAIAREATAARVKLEQDHNMITKVMKTASIAKLTKEEAKASNI